MGMITKNDLYKMSANDDEDAFDPIDYTLADLDEMDESMAARKRKYKDFYDDVKTERKLNEEDW